MSWLAYLFPSVRNLKHTLSATEASLTYWEDAATARREKIAELNHELTLTRKARDEYARQLTSALADLASARDARDVVHADLVSATDASARFRQMWEENAERAAKAERVAAFYRCAFGNVRRAVDNAVNDQPSLTSPAAPGTWDATTNKAYHELCVAIGT